MTSVKNYTRLSKFYDLGWGDFSKQYLDLIIELLDEHSVTQARVLDLACGTGILATELAEYGYIVHGIDISPDMIRVAKSKSTHLLNASFEVADMTEFKTHIKFDLITCTFDSINYLARIEELQKMLKCVVYNLSHSGLFIFDSNTRHLYSSYDQEKREQEMQGQRFVQQCKFNSLTNEATIKFVFADGTMEIHRQRPYDFDELEPLLSDVGLDVVHLFAWFDRRPYSSTTEKLFCVTEKL
jgi:SAM-dependent methyltransferase